ncbi:MULTISPECIES: caspase family protein [unclassified Rhizobium]|uniref:caspase family protein n=1 Tax=unclassified Rhizobium TaxID=2613769 RepID=UPI0006F6D0EA|nr:MULTISPECIES: caspase family protein [unclassified Rhizobium]KQV42474.1 hypothetical protein ASC86_19250 [Rhizobium sp. Root1212]KRD21495.1 hypothetical protein ASE37_18340 [Rhizobium sp. Root268]
MAILAGFLSSTVLAADRALVIGIGTYENLPEDMFLHGPKNDVKAISGLLTDKLGFKSNGIRLLTDQQATKAAILSSIREWLIEGTKPGDRVFLYFSGHGLQVKDESGDEEDGMDEAISTYDLKAGDEDWTNVILDDELEPLIAEMKGRAVTVVIDACHSGTISRSLSPQAVSGLKGARYLPRPFAAVKKPATRGLRIDLGVVDKPQALAEAGVTVWSAAAPYQVAWDDVRLPIEERHGVFTEAFVDGYRPETSDGNANGLISNAELLDYVTRESKVYCEAQEACDGIDPQLETTPEALGTAVVKPEPVVETPKQEKPESAYEEVKTDAAVAPVYVAADPLSNVGDILGRGDTGDVSVSLHPGPDLKSGEAFTISVTSRHDGQLVLLDVDGKGMATQIFPNTLARKITPLTAGQPLTIPDAYYGFDFEAEGEGENMLVAVVVEDDVDLTPVAPKENGLSEPVKAREALSDIVARLRKVWTGDTENRGTLWYAGTLKYRID